MGLSADAQRERMEERLESCCVAVEWPPPHLVVLLVLTA